MKEVCALVTVGGWSRLLLIEELVYQETILEVLSTFEVDRSPVGYARPRAIQFQLFGEPKHFSYTPFALLMGLYDTDFTDTNYYDELLIDLPPRVTASII